MIIEGSGQARRAGRPGVDPPNARHFPTPSILYTGRELLAGNPLALLSGFGSRQEAGFAGADCG